MALQQGTRLGAYEIISPLGAGGMGEVYRARDTKLQRDVALKILPETMARDAQRMARFEREAQVLASLNHPNIAAIYGLEESNGIRALVMELVEGQTLGERISVAPGLSPAQSQNAGLKAGATTGERRSPVPTDESLGIAKQIAEALEYAHERGVIHRDLKPANVKITPEGTVKVLDFGLAKVLDTQDSTATMDIANSPTLSAMATQAGMILGTAAYMSPEQAKGQRVDRRADIWAFGCVLYEMLAGRKPFEGETISDVLAAVIMKDPEWTAIPETTPPSVQRLVRRCLQKDQRQRLQAIGDARITIEETISGVGEPSGLPREGEALPYTQPQTSPVRRALPWGLAALLALTAVLFGYLYLRHSNLASEAALVESTIPPPTQAGFGAGLQGASLALSPDGKELVFSAPDSHGVRYLWLRSLSSMTARRLEGTANASGPFWSPDGKSIGFSGNSKLMRMELSGGPPTPLADAGLLRGASWSPQGVIVYSPHPDAHLLRIPASGGKATPATKLDPSGKGNSDSWPWFLPDGRHFLYSEMWDGSNKTTIYLGTLGSLDARVVVPQASSNAMYASGNLLYMEGNALLAQPFDLKRLVTTGPPASLASSAAEFGLAAVGAFSVSDNGTLVYQPGVADAESLSWFDRSGKLLSTVASSPSLQYPELSPHGRRAIVVLNGDLWILDLVHGTRSQFTFDGKENSSSWSPDGTQIAFNSARNGHYDLYIKPADGSAQSKLLYADPYPKFPTSWSPDGKFVIYWGGGPGGGGSYALPLAGARKPRLIAKLGFPRVSPNGHWAVYMGGYLTTFPRPGGIYHIPGRARFPRWSADGKNIYYVTRAGVLMEVSVRTHGNAAEIGTPHKLFGGILSEPGDPFAVAPDGKRILAITAGPGLATQPLTLIQNWPALLKKNGK